jgi:hypothetical protein
MRKDNCERVPLYRFTVGHTFGLTKRDRNQVASSLADLMSPWGVPADVQLKDQHTITIDVYSPLTKEQHRMLSSQIPREAQRIKRYLRGGFEMTNQGDNPIRVGLQTSYRRQSPRSLWRRFAASFDFIQTLRRR